MKKRFTHNIVVSVFCTLLAVSPLQAADGGILRSDYLRYGFADDGLAGELTPHNGGGGVADSSFSAVGLGGYGKTLLFIGGLAAAGFAVSKLLEDDDAASGSASDNGLGSISGRYSERARACTSAENGAIYKRFDLEDARLSGIPSTGYVVRNENVVIDVSNERVTAPDGFVLISREFMRTDTGAPPSSHLTEFGAASMFGGEMVADGVFSGWDVQLKGSLKYDFDNMDDLAAHGFFGAIRDADTLSSPVTITLAHSEGSSNPPRAYAVFQQKGFIYIAQPVLDTSSTPLTCTGSETTPVMLTADQFAWGGSGIISDGIVFGLRDGLRGYLHNNAVQLGNFSFYSDTKLKNLHVEHRITPWQNGVLALHADSGYKRWNDGKSEVFYNKMTALRTVSSQMEVYLQAASGGVVSDLYKNSPMRGFAAGAFYNNLLRHDDSYHVRLEQRFAAVEAAEWRLAADVSIGSEGHYWRFGTYHNWQSGSGAHAFYTREL